MHMESILYFLELTCSCANSRNYSFLFIGGMTRFARVRGVLVCVPFTPLKKMENFREIYSYNHTRQKKG